MPKLQEKEGCQILLQSHGDASAGGFPPKALKMSHEDPSSLKSTMLASSIRLKNKKINLKTSRAKGLL